MSHPDPNLAAPLTAPSPRQIRARLDLWAKPQAKRLRLASALGLADTACVAGFAWGLSHMVSDLFGHTAQVAHIAIPMAASVLSLAARSGLGLVGQRLNLNISRTIIAALRLDIMDTALAGRLARPAQLNSLFEDSEALEGYYARFRQASVRAAVTPLVILVLIASQSLIGAGILALTLVPFITLMALLGMSSAAESHRQLDALSRLSHLFVDRIATLPLILAFHNGPRQSGVIARAASDVATRTLHVLKVAFLTSAVLEFFSALSVALIAVYCGFSLLGQLPFHVPEHLTLATAFFVLTLSPEVYAPMRQLSAAYHDRQSAMAATQRLMALEIRETQAPALRLDAAPVITYDSVVCGFADDPGFRIGPVSFTARPGSVTAISGPTGSGKTTLLRLLLGQGLMTGGMVSIDGAATLSDLSGDLGNSIAWVSQSPPILAGTLRDNLILANRAASDADIAHAVTQVGLGDLVARPRARRRPRRPRLRPVGRGAQTHRPGARRAEGRPYLGARRTDRRSRRHIRGRYPRPPAADIRRPHGIAVQPFATPERLAETRVVLS